MKNKNGKKIPNIDKHHKTSLISTCCSPQSFFHQQLPQNYHSKFQINIDKHVAKEFDCCSIFTNTRLSNFLMRGDEVENEGNGLVNASVFLLWFSGPYSLVFPSPASAALLLL